MTENTLLNKYKQLIKKIGIKNLMELPEEEKEKLKNARTLEEKVIAFEKIKGV